MRGLERLLAVSFLLTLSQPISAETMEYLLPDVAPSKTAVSPHRRRPVRHDTAAEALSLMAANHGASAVSFQVCPAPSDGASPAGCVERVLQPGSTTGIRRTELQIPVDGLLVISAAPVPDGALSLELRGEEMDPVAESSLFATGTHVILPGSSDAARDDETLVFFTAGEASAIEITYHDRLGREAPGARPVAMTLAPYTLAKVDSRTLFAPLAPNPRPGPNMEAGTFYEVRVAGPGSIGAGVVTSARDSDVWSFQIGKSEGFTTEGILIPITDEGGSTTRATFRNAFLGFNGATSWSFFPANRQNMTCEFNGSYTVCGFQSDIFASSVGLTAAEIVNIPDVQIDSRKSGAGLVEVGGTAAPGGRFPIFAWASVDGRDLPVLTDLDAGWADSCPHPCFPLSFRTDLVASGLRWFGGWYAKAHIANTYVRDLVYTLEVLDDRGNQVTSREVPVFAKSTTTVDLSDVDPNARSLRQIRLLVHAPSGSAGERALMVVETGRTARPEMRRFLRPQTVLPGGPPLATEFNTRVVFYGLSQEQPVTWETTPSAETVKAILEVTDEELIGLRGIRFYECALHKDGPVNSVPEIFARWSRLDAQVQQDFVGEPGHADAFIFANGMLHPCGGEDSDGKVLLAISITVNPLLVQETSDSKAAQSSDGRH